MPKSWLSCCPLTTLVTSCYSKNRPLGAPSLDSYKFPAEGNRRRAESADDQREDDAKMTETPPVAGGAGIREPGKSRRLLTEEGCSCVILIIINPLRRNCLHFINFY